MTPYHHLHFFSTFAIHLHHKGAQRSSATEYGGARMCVTAEISDPINTHHQSRGRLVLIEDIQTCFFRQAYRLVLSRQDALFTIEIPGRSPLNCRGFGVPDLNVEDLSSYANPWGEAINRTINEQQHFEMNTRPWHFRGKLFLLNQHQACWLFCSGQQDNQWSLEGFQEETYHTYTNRLAYGACARSSKASQSSLKPILVW